MATAAPNFYATGADHLETDGATHGDFITAARIACGARGANPTVDDPRNLYNALDGMEITARDRAFKPPFNQFLSVANEHPSNTRCIEYLFTAATISSKESNGRVVFTFTMHTVAPSTLADQIETKLYNIISSLTSRDAGPNININNYHIKTHQPNFIGKLAGHPTSFTLDVPANSVAHQVFDQVMQKQTTAIQLIDDRKAEQRQHAEEIAERCKAAARARSSTSSASR